MSHRSYRRFSLDHVSCYHSDFGRRYLRSIQRLRGNISQMRGWSGWENEKETQDYLGSLLSQPKLAHTRARGSVDPGQG
jgi:hypothetical protein